jgi:hypothetical protein
MSSIVESHQSLTNESAIEVVAAPEPELTLWRWSVEKYLEMVRVGIIDQDRVPMVLDGRKVAEIPVGVILQ